MIPALLALALVAAAPQADDSIRSNRLHLAALERQADLDLDSSLVLLRAARDAAPASLVAHLEYIGLAVRRMPGGVPDVRREYTALPPGPLRECLLAYLSVPRSNLPAAAPHLVEMERRGTAGGCPTVLLTEIVGDMVPRRLWEPRRLDYLERAVAILPDAWWLWMRYASALVASHEFDRADAALTEALGRFQHPLQAVRLQLRKASLLVRRGDTTSALALTRAIAAAVARDGRPGLRVEYLRALDEVLDPTNMDGNALDSALRAGAQLAHEHGAWEYEWRFRYSLALRLTDRGRPLAALPEYARQIEIADSVGSLVYAMPSYMKRSRALERLGRLDEAEADLLHAIDEGTDREFPYVLAECYHNLAEVYASAGRLAEASRAADRFVATIRPLGHSPLRMTAFLVAGEVRWRAGWHAAARRALDSMVAVVDYQEQNRYYAGEYYERTGNLGAAKRYYATAAGEGEDLGRNLRGLVRVYQALGQLDSAEYAARQHDRYLAEETDVPLLPDVLARSGDFGQGIQTASDWAGRRLAQGNVEGAATAHLQWADLLVRSGRGAEAIPVLDLVDSLVAIRDLLRMRIEAMRLRGLALAAEGYRTEAEVDLAEAARLAREHPTADNVIATHLALGEVLAAGDRPLDALDVLDVAADQAWAVTGSLEEDFDRVRHRAQSMAPFDAAIRLLLAMPDSARTVRRVIAWSQRRKAGALALATQGAAPMAGSPRPLSLAEIWARLEPEEALIDYLITDSATAAIVVTRGRTALHRLPLSADSLEQLVRGLRAPFGVTFNGRVDLARAPFQLDLAHALYAALVAPLEPELGDVERLLLVPDGIVHYVPFAALVRSTRPRASGDAYLAARYLVDRYETAFLPSAAFLSHRGLAHGRQVDRGAGVLAMAYEAPGAVPEVRAIAAAWDGGRVQRLEDGAATETAAQNASSAYAVFHVAAHAVTDDADPLASYLRLAPDAEADGLLHLSEIAERPHQGQLVVLSACETQMGRLYYGEGVMGLTRAFLATGASAVVATQWPVGAAAADLMAEFYGATAFAHGLAAALREAQLQLRRESATSHPFYWASFGLYVGS